MSIFDMTQPDTWISTLCNSSEKYRRCEAENARFACKQVYAFFETPFGREAVTASLSIALTLCSTYHSHLATRDKDPGLSPYQAKVPLGTVMEPIWRAKDCWIFPSTDENRRHTLIARRGSRLILAALMHAGFKVKRLDPSSNLTRHKSDTLLIDWSDGLKGAKP